MDHRFQHHAAHKTVVNVSSLGAIMPFSSMSTYCAGKAARDMFHQVLAEEQIKYFPTPSISNFPSSSSSSSKVPEQGKLPGNKAIRVLNYAPGPMDTDMHATIREFERTDTVKYGSAFNDSCTNNTLVDVNESADKLALIVMTPSGYKSGSHIDFYDAFPAAV
jgi:sepiapterin reductase